MGSPRAGSESVICRRGFFSSCPDTMFTPSIEILGKKYLPFKFGSFFPFWLSSLFSCLVFGFSTLCLTNAWPGNMAGWPPNRGRVVINPEDAPKFNGCRKFYIQPAAEPKFPEKENIIICASLNWPQAENILLTFRKESLKMNFLCIKVTI